MEDTMDRNNRKQDILDTMDIYSYIYELMRLPKGKASPGHNLDENVKHGCISCVRAREFGSYRSLCLREQRTRVKLMELTRDIAACERANSPRLPLMYAELRRMTVDLAELTLRRRRLEDRRDCINSKLVKSVVQHRYFDDIHRRIPSWQQTAKDMGIALSGDELRRLVCRQFEEDLK